MRSYVTLFVSLLLFFGASSCKKPHGGVSTDYLIIGQAGGFIGGAMTPYYKVSSSQFQKDVSIGYQYPPDDIHGFHFTVNIPSPGFDSVKDLVNQVPAELLTGSRSIGESWPDAGYTEVWASIHGVTYRWLFQINLDTASAEVQAFAEKVHVVFKY